ncbi:hypothetical protein ACH5RR_011564 [Cinchona calisaya]|uniref:Protein PHLOEM PROTEIN 2-LIKE A10 n=1 Tax=Cinchona calisaya TaxID=153742 RepID=A0ABD3AB50_9GENT
MDLDLLKWGFDYSKKKKKWVLTVGAFYGAYIVYHLPSVAKKRKTLSKLLGTLVHVAEVVTDSAEAIGVVSKDLKEFLQSDSDQIPRSLKQISKITRSDEISESLMRITSALTVGILRGNRQEKLSNRQEKLRKNGGSMSTKSDFSDRVLDKLFSDAGSGFASVVIGSFARNLVVAYYSNKELNVDSKLSVSSNVEHVVLEPLSTPRWADVLFEDKCRELIGDCVQMFVSTAVSVFLDKTMCINPYDELFSGMTNPKHETKVREMLSSICNGAVETLVRSSHQVLANTDRDVVQSPSRDDKALIQRKWMSIGSKASKLSYEKQDTGRMRKMFSTLAVPNSRKFVLDVTGRVTFETLRSFLEFLLEKISECLKRSVDIIHEEVVDRGIEVFQHLCRESSAVVSICLSLCLHILNGPWILVPTQVN